MINSVSVYFKCCLPSHVRLFAAPWTALRQKASIPNCLPEFTQVHVIELVMYKENEIYWKTMWLKTIPLLLLVTGFPLVKHAMLISFSGYLSLLLYSFYPEAFPQALLSFSHLIYMLSLQKDFCLIVLSKIAHPCLWEQIQNN